MNCVGGRRERRKAGLLVFKARVQPYEERPHRVTGSVVRVCFRCTGLEHRRVLVTCSPDA